jgi:hypothetical protein
MGSKCGLGWATHSAPQHVGDLEPDGAVEVAVDIHSRAAILKQEAL